MLVVLIGKTCSGKDTIAQKLAMKDDFHLVVRYTTRPRRRAEKQGINYHYISDDEFKQKISENFFLEYQTFTVEDGSVWYYGTSWESVVGVEDDERWLIILTPAGYRKLRDMPNAPKHKAIYIYANNRTIMRRLKKRKDKNDSPQRRLEQDNEDFKGVENEVDRIVYNNDGADVEEVIEKIMGCLK